jgi:hypothetical protein
MKTRIKPLAPLLVFACVLLESGCNTVAGQPWERAALADYSMRANRDPLAAAAAEHTYFSRESAHGGRGVGGSGCGCN